jgi:hypothetical protein
MDYLIKGVIEAGPPRVLASIHLSDDGQVTFNEKCGDADFVASLKNGVSSIYDPDAERIKPEDGRRFIEAVRNLYSSYPVWMGEKDELAALDAQYADLAEVA